MKAKLVLGDLTGYVHMKKGTQDYYLAVVAPLSAAMSGSMADTMQTQALHFRFHRYDDDRCAIFRFAGIK